MGSTTAREVAAIDSLFDRNYGQTAIHVAYADGVRIATNRFIASPLSPPGKARTALHLESSRNITLKGNTVGNPAAQDTLISIGKNVEAITGNDATGIAGPPAASAF